MKKLLLLALYICFSTLLFSQTDGISYQAVIIGPDDLELPGVDSQGNYLPNATIAIKFSILDANNDQNNPLFVETRTVDTDEFGRVNLIIGLDNDEFKEINWDGEIKFLRVEIDFEGGTNFEFLSNERLTYLPYVLHRDIKATGTLTVDDRTFLNGELVVEGPANFNDALTVTGDVPSYLSGTLTVDGETNINNAFRVNGQNPTDLSGSLRVGGNANFESDLSVLGLTALNDLTVTGQASFGDMSVDNLTVNLSSVLNGQTTINGQTLIDGQGNQVRITSNLPNQGNTIENHPLLIDGGNNGLAIRVNGSRSNDTNFITFYDQMSNTPWGRIEGEIPSEFGNNADYEFDQSSLEFDIYDSEIDLGFAIAHQVISGAQLIKASTDFRACIGLGGCLASPGPADIGFAGVELISATAQTVLAALVLDRSNLNKAIYDNNKIIYQGVTYASGAGDYAEYLKREDLNENITYGDIVGLKGGKISKNVIGAERVMVVSYKPIVLGNMPPKDRESEYEKVAFMGQVPVKVYGKVKIGDYIIPSGMNDGTGVAISPEDIRVGQIKHIVGVAWSENNQAISKSMINVAVGINKNDNNPIIKKLENKISIQSQEITELKTQIADIYKALNDIKNGKPLNALNEDESYNELPINNYYNRKYEVAQAEYGEIVYWEITKEDIQKAFDMARKQMVLNGVDVENNYFWNKIDNDPAYKETLITELIDKLDKQLHYHKSVFTKD
ncbi:hypothetical protein [Winogradskyella jejuensis]|uniref:Peptidase S74 domain-containing protein n=1 Tax=Winogradskyella jejuensis TaxID=1089305 RepID=A0A1M5SAY1_9FLAO|nr:hypothetical protein [Winogradskyella jejuensis]SHH35621.1 hypothetical protein SAMN05444148_1818 [Winogradskyella jejuensis]